MEKKEEYRYRGHLWFAMRPGVGRLTEPMAPEFQRAEKGWEKTPPYLAYHMFDKAHTVMLTEQGIIPKGDGAAILRAFREMEAEGVLAERVRVGGVDHSGESYLIEKLGWEVGGRIHIGRSTGDLATVSQHITQREYILEAMELLTTVRMALADFAEKHVETIWPMYSPGLTVYGSSYILQHAQPMTLGFYAMAFLNQLEREQRKLEAAYDLSQISPAGSAIGTGTDIPGFDRHRTMDLLGFDALYRNCYDAEKHEWYTLDSFAVLLTLSHVISGLFYDMLIFSSNEFGLVDPADRYCGTSSIMPQKRNPTALRFLADLTVNVKSRMLGADSVDGMHRSWTDINNGLRMIPGILSTLKIDSSRAEELAGAHWAGASDLAAAVVREKGLSWRTAHQIVATLVRVGVERGVKPSQVTEENLDEAATMYPDYGRNLGLSTQIIQEAMDPRKMVYRRTLIGGPAPVRVLEEIGLSQRKIEEDSVYIMEKRRKLEKAAGDLEEAIDGIIGN